MFKKPLIFEVSGFFHWTLNCLYGNCFTK